MLSQQLESLPLRQRFLVVPLLGLLLIASLTLVVCLETRIQTASLAEISDRRLADLDRFTALFHRLSAEHSQILDLLSSGSSGALDEEELYERSQDHLDRIRNAIDDLKEALADDGARPNRPVRGALAEAAGRYRQTAATAIELGTVDLRVAERRLVEANNRYVELNALFTDLLEQERAEIGASLDAIALRSWTMTVWVAASGLSLSAFLLLMSIVLSRLLARSLERQLDALTELGREAGATIASRAKDQVAAISGAIGAFRTALRRLRQNEQELSAVNEALTRARDELEMRVEERTRELSEANTGLRNEVERRRQAEEHLRIYAEVIRATGEAVVIAGSDGKILEVNPAYERVTGYRRREVVGKPLHHRAIGVVSQETIEEIQRAIANRGNWSGEISTRRKGGEVFPAWATLNAVEDDDGKLRHVVSVSRDITELKENELKLQRLAFYDTLTGLPNRALFADRLRMSLASAKRNRTVFAVLYLDLDRFKFVNDALGHPAGDKLLIEISDRLREQVRASDTVARIGGDEYTLVLNGIHSEADAVLVAERLIEEVARPAEIDGDTVFVGASIGISFYPRDAEDPDVLRKYADMALYEAKQAGRGQYRVFAADMLARAEEQLTLTVRLEAALEHDELMMVYQPIVDASSGAASSLEALLRWRRPDGIVALPGTFLPQAEETGLIRRIDLWALDRACTDAAAWRSTVGRGLRISVNVSGSSLRQPDLPRQLEEILNRTGLPAELLNLEVSETAIVADPRVASTVLREIAELGVDISMDDFGTVYSSLSHLLTQFPIHHIKLSRNFVERIGKNEASERLIHALMHLTRKLRIDVVAIGVEAGEQESFLHEAGCKSLQGYHFVEPLPSDRILAWVAEHEVAATPSTGLPGPTGSRSGEVPH